jgi:hypothetical protein
LTYTKNRRYTVDDQKKKQNRRMRTMRIEFNDDTHITVTLAKREDLYLIDDLPIDRQDENKFLVRVNGTDRVTGFLINGTQIERVDVNLANKTVSRVKYGPVPEEQDQQ